MRIRRLHGLAGVLALICAAIVAGGASMPRGTDTASSQPQSKILYWWDPMLGPSSIRDHPGKSAMGMELVPVYAGQISAGPDVIIDPVVVQNMGVRTARVTRGTLTRTIRAVGIFQVSQPGMHDVSLHVGGWIEKLYADQDGMHIHQGEPLFSLYSPELQIAGQELISAGKARSALGAGADKSAMSQAEAMVQSARRKLQLLGIDKQEIDAIEHAASPPVDLIFRSPATGHIEDKTVVEGSAVRAGEMLMRIADHTKVWLDARIYEDDIPLVSLGQTIEVSTDSAPGQTFTGKITLIYPHVDPSTRTLTVRATFDSHDFQLKPGMYARAKILTAPLPEVIQVPREAVIDTGTRQIAFVTDGNGHFSPRRVRLGIEGDNDRVQILEGLAPGEMVVTSGQFLLDVQSRTNEAIAKLRGVSAEMAEPANMPSSSQPAPTPQATTAPASAPANSQPATPGALSVIHCPMAEADWIQVGDIIANPYLGPEMHGCGSVTGHVKPPATKSKLSDLVSAYLDLERGLAAQRVDVSALKRLKSAADGLQGGAAAGVRGAADALSRAKDLDSIRREFKKLNAALIPLLKEQGQ